MYKVKCRTGCGQCGRRQGRCVHECPCPVDEIIDDDRIGKHESTKRPQSLPEGGHVNIGIPLKTEIFFHAASFPAENTCSVGIIYNCMETITPLQFHNVLKGRHVPVHTEDRFGDNEKLSPARLSF